MMAEIISEFAIKSEVNGFWVGTLRVKYSLRQTKLKEILCT